MTKVLTKLARIAYRTAESKITREYRPFFLSHLVTPDCNFGCGSCHWNGPSEQLSIEDTINLYQQAKENGFLGNYIWGGEPLMSRDIAEIVQASSENDFLTIVNTNGWFLENKIDKLKPYVDLFVVSLHGVEADTHNKITKMPGAYERAIKGIKAVKKAGIPVIVNSLVLRENQDEIYDLLRLWEELDVVGYINFIEQGLLTSEGFNASKEPYDVSEEKRRKIAFNLLQYKKITPRLLNTTNYFETFVNGKKPYICHLPKISVEVYPDGTFIDCTQIDEPLGNIRDEPLEEILRLPRIKGMIEDGEKGCCVHNNADRIDTSNAWNFNPEILSALAKIAWNTRLSRKRHE